MKQQNADLAQDAFMFWRERKYTDCLAALKNVESNLNTSSSDDSKLKPGIDKVKIEHNIALTDFVHSGSNDPESLESCFGTLAKRIVEEIKSSIMNTGVEETSGLENNEDSTSSAAANLTEVSRLGNSMGGKFQPDACFALYNQAVVLVHLRKWRSALTLLEDLFRYIDALDESLALCICFLLLDVYTLVARGSGYGDGGLLLGYIVEKAQSVVDYLEKPHIFNGHTDWANTAASQTSNEISEDQSTAGDDQAPQRYSDGAINTFSGTEIKQIHKRLSIYKYKLVLIQAAIASAKTDIKAPNAAVLKDLEENILAIGNDQVIDQVTDPKDVAFLGLQLEGPHQQSFEGIGSCLKANMEYLQGNYEESFKLLQRSAKLGIEPGLFWNNLGCIHHMLNQHRCAAMYFTWAFKFYSIQGSKPVRDKFSAEIAFNLGVQLLQSGHPRRAYECFVVAAQCNYHRPRLWLHVAECAVMAHAKDEANVGPSKIIGNGSTRRILLNKDNESKLPASGDQLDLYIGLSSTDRALFLLKNAEHDAMLGTNAQSSIVARSSNEDGKMRPLLASKSINGGNGSFNVLESDTDQCRQQAKAIRQSVLLCRAYLALVVEDWSLATAAAREALTLAQAQIQQGDENSYALCLSHSYLAEALLHQPLAEKSKAQAIEHMTMALKNDVQGVNAKEVALFKAAVSINAALVRLLHGELDEAERLLHQAIEQVPNSSHAIRALAFLYLERGEPDRARHLLKTGR